MSVPFFFFFFFSSDDILKWIQLSMDFFDKFLASINLNLINF